MRKFKNFCNEVVFLSHETFEHIKEVHSEVKIAVIRETTLASPDEVRRSVKKTNSDLYYLKRKKSRFICVVVKNCDDGNFISTALTTSRPKTGIVIYKKET